MSNAQKGEGSDSTDTAPNAKEELTFVTWNIAGLHKNLLRERTEAVIETITKMAADIVFLQEVIPETFSMIKSEMTDYECIAAKTSSYYVATLLRRGRVDLDGGHVNNFLNSAMDRHVLVVQVRIVIFDMVQWYRLHYTT